MDDANEVLLYAFLLTFLSFHLLLVLQLIVLSSPLQPLLPLLFHLIKHKKPFIDILRLKLSLGTSQSLYLGYVLHSTPASAWCFDLRLH